MKVLLRKAALSSIEQIADHIANEVSMPETAMKYTERLIEFGYSLGSYFKAYPLCRSTKLLAQRLHCATFDKKWIFA